MAMVLALVASALVASGSLASTATPPGLPLYQFASTGSGPLPWNATALAPELANTTMLGAAHSAVNAAEGVLAYRTAKSHVALFTQPTIGDPTFADLSTQVNAPTPGADPVPFFDPAWGVDVAYVDTVGGLVILSANDPTGAFWPRAHRLAAWHAEAVSDLSLATGVTFANGLPSVAPSPTGATLAARTVTGDVEVLS
ncbi:MAG: hypothetical protein ACRDV0_06515, partial [Acidimicrobiales bacterium]